jgi:hypothetical protein
MLVSHSKGAKRVQQIDVRCTECQCDAPQSSIIALADCIHEEQQKGHDAIQSSESEGDPSCIEIRWKRIGRAELEMRCRASIQLFTIQT